MKNGIRLMVGLGNPGQQYQDTRHNAGAWFVEQLARQHKEPLKRDSKYNALTARLHINGQEIRLIVPQTFMNLSGQSVAPMANFYKINADQILVAHDELDLPPGTARLKQGGGHGGHNGLRDIIDKLGNNRDFARLRIGIGHPGSSNQVTSYVLGRANQAEQDAIQAAITDCLTIVPLLISGDANKAMNQLHTPKNH